MIATGLSYGATIIHAGRNFGAQYPGGTSVFSGGPVALLLQDDRGPEIAIATGFPYRLSPAQLAPLFISQAGGAITLAWNGPGSLQWSSALGANGWTTLTNASSPYIFQAANTQFFRLTE